MKTFGQYFKYHFRSTFLRFVIMMAIVLTVSFVNIEDIVRYRYDFHQGYSPKTLIGTNVDMDIFTFIFGTLCTIMPIFELYGFRNRRNLDTIFTLPISRAKMLFAHLLNGWIHVTVAFVAEAVMIFSALRQEKDWVNESYIFGYYFSLLAIGLAAYLFFSFVFLQGNTVIDGIIFMAVWSFALMLAFMAVNNINYNYFREINPENYRVLNEWIDDIGVNMCVFSPFGEITSMYESAMSINYSSEIYLHKTIIGVTFWCVIGVISLVLLYFTFKKQRVERVEDISNSPIGYKFLIPFCIISLIFYEHTEIIYVLGELIAMLVAYIVYRRTFKIKKWDIIMIGITVSTAIIVWLLK